MTASLLPRVAAALDASGKPWFGAAWDGLPEDDESTVVWLAEPVLLPGHHWVEPSVVPSALALDVGAVAELLAHAFAVAPDALDALPDYAVVALVAMELDRVHCDMAVCCAEVAADLADYTPSGRFARCVLRAARLLGAEA